ncbi:hypothetical protein [Paenibacillus bovis]|uniref:Competence protein n=1 Tax=Paenibacillus bovis TaxID=1616788 RepID=A0A1X9T498_9BACL|nr:hypothetical protein [Paenibacillus bovis]ARR10689.1 hypothetical protein AR543_p0081 [Paenibacillus bovis]
MKYAIDKVAGKRYSIAEWKIHCENRTIGRCEVCGEDVYIRAKETTSTAAHFAHYQGTKCPTKAGNRTPFLNLRPSAIDEKNSLEIRQELERQLYKVYNKCSALTGGLRIATFRKLIQNCHQRNVWAYKGLTFKYVPYLLLASHEKFVKEDLTSTAQINFYFTLAPAIRYSDDLWNQQKNVAQSIWKVCPDGEIINYPIDADLDVEPEWFNSTRKQIKKMIF